MAKRSVALLSISSGITIRAAFVCRPIETHINVYQKESFLFLHFILYDHHFFFPSVLGKNVNSNNNKKKLLFSPATNYEYRTRARVNARTEKPFWSKITALQTITHTRHNQVGCCCCCFFPRRRRRLRCVCSLCLSFCLFIPVRSRAPVSFPILAAYRRAHTSSYWGFFVCLVFDMK